jgi:hypothetical protein
VISFYEEDKFPIAGRCCQLIKDLHIEGVRLYKGNVYRIGVTTDHACVFLFDKKTNWRISLKEFKTFCRNLIPSVSDFAAETFNIPK